MKKLNISGYFFFGVCVRILVLWPLGCGAAVVDHINDPEPPVTWTPPWTDSHFAAFTLGANYSGLLYAGTVEFNWIVDIRIPNRDQEEWATGNLVSFYHVLTTCQALKILQAATGTGTHPEKDPDTGWEIVWYANAQEAPLITYCENYLWTKKGTSLTYGGTYDTDIGGKRLGVKSVNHPFCRKLTLTFDAAIIILSPPIHAREPRVGFMPFGFDYIRDEMFEMVTLNPNAPITYRSPVCYVASFGRNYVNSKEFFVLDHKVKHRVYITKWKDCADNWSYVCNKDKDKRCGDTSLLENVRDNLMCMRPRARVGTVCDHDRGAPLVCNGRVIGMVIRGAEFRHCNNLYKIPFIVEKLQHIRKFLRDSINYAVQPVERKRAGRIHGKAKASASLNGVIKTQLIFSLLVVYQKGRTFLNN